MSSAGGVTVTKTDPRCDFSTTVRAEGHSGSLIHDSSNMVSVLNREQERRLGVAFRYAVCASADSAAVTHHSTPEGAPHEASFF